MHEVQQHFLVTVNDMLGWVDLFILFPYTAVHIFVLCFQSNSKKKSENVDKNATIDGINVYCMYIYTYKKYLEDWMIDFFALRNDGSSCPLL